MKGFAHNSCALPVPQAPLKLLTKAACQFHFNDANLATQLCAGKSACRVASQPQWQGGGAGAGAGQGCDLGAAFAQTLLTSKSLCIWRPSPAGEVPAHKDTCQGDRCRLECSARCPSWQGPVWQSAAGQPVGAWLAEGSFLCLRGPPPCHPCHVLWPRPLAVGGLCL